MSNVLADHVESADAILLVHSDQIDANELRMTERLLRELNPGATLVLAKAGYAPNVLSHLGGHGGAGAGKPALAMEERAGWWQSLVAARTAGSSGLVGEVEEAEAAEEEEKDGGDEEEGEGEEEEEGSEDERETEEEMEARIREHLSALTKAQLKQTVRDIGLPANGHAEELIRYERTLSPS